MLVIEYWIMTDTKQYNKIGIAVENFVDDLIFGKDEDIFIRYKRREEFYDALVGSTAVTFVPGLYAYRAIKYFLKNPSLKTKEKIALCAEHLAAECVRDGLLISVPYLMYKLMH